MVGPGKRFWVEELDAEEKDLIEHGQGEIELEPDALIVGGGIMGLTTALALQTATVGSVQLIEASILASGATGGSAGLLQPEPHQGDDPASLVELGRLSLDLWRHLDARTPGGVGLVEQDWIGLAPHPVGFLADPPPSARWLDQEEVRQLIPVLAVPVSAVIIENQARLNPQRAAARLARQLPRIATRVVATAATIRGGKITALSSTAGTFKPGIVVFATGMPPRIDGLEVAIPADLVKGHLLVTEPTSIELPATTASVGVPIGGGRLLVGGTLDVDDASTDVRDEVIVNLHAQLCAALRGGAEIAVSHRWCCWRPHHPDGLPVLDRVPGLDNAWVTSGHYRTGLLMGPATGALLAEWITTARQPSTAQPFSLARFASQDS